MNVFVSVHVPVCVSLQNTSFCQSAGRGINSHLMTAVVVFSFYIFRKCLTVFVI